MSDRNATANAASVGVDAESRDHGQPLQGLQEGRVVPDKTEYRTNILFVILGVFLCLASGCSTKNWTAKDWFDRGFSQTNEGKHRDSIRSYTQAIEVDPSYALAYENRGYAHSTLGNYREALDDYNKVLSLKDKRVPVRDTYREIGVVYFRMGKLEEAVAAWKKGLGKAKDDADLLNNLAVAYLNLKQIDKATEAAASAYALDPSLPEVINTMGEVAMVKKEFQKAADLFVRAIDLNPYAAHRYWNAAMAFEKVKSHDNALEYAKRYVAMEKDPVARQKAYELIERLKNAKSR